MSLRLDEPPAADSAVRAGQRPGRESCMEALPHLFVVLLADRDGRPDVDDAPALRLGDGEVRPAAFALVLPAFF